MSFCCRTGCAGVDRLACGHEAGFLTLQVQAEDKAIISIQAGHDASIAISSGSRIQCVLELEPRPTVPTG